MNGNKNDKPKDLLCYVSGNKYNLGYEKLPVYYGYLLGSSNTVEEGKMFGLSCESCNYYDGDCCCTLHKEMQKQKGMPETYSVTYVSYHEYSAHEPDTRGICEFYKFLKTRGIYQVAGTLFRDMAGNEYSGLNSVYRHIIEKLEGIVSTKQSYIVTLLERASDLEKRINEMGKFDSFIKNEIPDVHKKLKAEYKRRTEND